MSASSRLDWTSNERAYFHVATDLLKNLVFLKYSEICEFLEKFHVKMEEKNEKPKVKTKRRVPGLVPICDSRKRPLPQLKETGLVM